MELLGRGAGHNNMQFIFKPIGYIRMKAYTVPRHWTVSNVEGEIVIEPEYKLGLKDIYS